MAADNIRLGRLLVDLPKAAPREECGVDVRFTYDVNGLLQVEATVLRTKQTFAVVIQGNPGLLSDEEIARRLAALADLKIHPRERMEHRTLFARAERVYQQMRGEDREWLGRQILEYERILDKQDLRAIAPAREAFEKLIGDIERDSYIGPAPA
jgi:molecular chaperone HscC